MLLDDGGGKPTDEGCGVDEEDGMDTSGPSLEAGSDGLDAFDVALAVDDCGAGTVLDAAEDVGGGVAEEAVEDVGGGGEGAEAGGSDAGATEDAGAGEEGLLSGASEESAAALLAGELAGGGGALATDDEDEVLGGSSTWHVPLHPSPFTVLPSSHCSPVSIMALPQTGSPKDDDPPCASMSMQSPLSHMKCGGVAATHASSVSTRTLGRYNMPMRRRLCVGSMKILVL